MYDVMIILATVRSITCETSARKARDMPRAFLLDQYNPAAADTHRYVTIQQPIP
jgi:hypothetical protein